ncbi:MAG: cytochrome b/b6 domain-containing protein, partial [Pseudomonadota bacterium]
MTQLVLRRALIGALALFSAIVALPVSDADAQAVRPPEAAVSNAPTEPGIAGERDFRAPGSVDLPETRLQNEGLNSQSTLWREVRQGEVGLVSIPNKNAGLLVHSAGADWIWWRDGTGPLVTWAIYSLGAILAVLVLFYLVRGRIRVDHGLSGVTIQRFAGIERFAHWLLAGSFILLALTGLNLLLGKEYLMPLIGKEAFAQMSIAGKWVHNNISWAFMAGILLTFVLWVGHNFPHKTDIKWMLQAGGLFSKNLHPPARKFNAGQKLIFWSTVLLGGSISASGLSLLFPGQ